MSQQQEKLQHNKQGGNPPFLLDSAEAAVARKACESAPGRSCTDAPNYMIQG